MASLSLPSLSLASLSSSRPTPTGGNPNNFFPPGSGPQELTSSASLYLYTFLATILFILLISGTIIIRSYALRRHQRALLAEAIANGTHVLPKVYRDEDRPKMFEVHIIGRNEAPQPEEYRHSEKEESGGNDTIADWEKIKPISCRWLNAPDDTATTTRPTPAPTPHPSPRRQWLPWPFRRHREPLLPTSASDSDNATQTRPLSRSERSSRSTDLFRASVSSTEKPPITPEPEPELVRVSVLISMPFANGGRRTPREDGEQELPYLEFGTAEVCSDGLGPALARPPTPPPLPSTPATPFRPPPLMLSLSRISLPLRSAGVASTRGGGP